MQSAAPENKKRVRLRAGSEEGVGNTRYALLKAAAERIAQAMQAEYWLEAVTLVESILAERLEKRAQYLHDHSADEHKPALANVKDGFKNLGSLFQALNKYEQEPELHRVLRLVDGWSRGRNRAIHEMAKYGIGAREGWTARLARARAIAKDGIAVLLAYDQAERRACHATRKKRHASATCPDALAPIGQEYCEDCLSAQREVLGTKLRRQR